MTKKKLMDGNNLLTEKVIEKERNHDHKRKESYYKCLTCKECFDDLRKVKFHQPTCKYFCERCRRQLDPKLAILIHVIEHNMEDEPEPEYECDQCFLEFYNLNEYEHHQKSCSRETVASQINLNSSDSSLRSTQKQHTAKINGHLEIFDSDNILEKSKYYCRYCNIGFNSQSYLNNHLTTNSDGQQYGCHECGKFFLDKSFLVKHLEIDNRRKPYKCDTGLKCTAKSSNLNAHINIHTDENRLKGNVCGKCFTRKYNLDRHIRTHTGKKPFKCNYCNKCFTQNVTLKSHIRSHTGEKPFKCKFCDKCFTTKGILSHHFKTHTGEKSFKCIYCEKCFTQAVNLKSHIRIHTGEKPFFDDLL